MHFMMLILGLGFAWLVRCLPLPCTTNLSLRWQHTLVLFLFSPLLLLMTAIAILWMGPTGQMMGHWEGSFSYYLAFGFLVWAIASGGKLAWEGWQTLQHIRQNPVIQIQGTITRLLDTSTLYSAQVGFWQPELVVSQGLLDQLDAEHLAAVLVHEQAHAQYHDTFWFFWLGWLRRLTGWLPSTESLWQELLMLRELRADRYAAQQVDPLVLAESLLLVVAAPIKEPEWVAAFSPLESRDRLTERINALLDTSPVQRVSYSWSILGLLLVLLPLATIPLHVG
jgi:Zn-dependent protease with chaperone function